PLVAFHSKLLKGRAPVPAVCGLKERFRCFSGKNASAAPVPALIGELFLVGYTMDYQQHHKNHPQYY
ncbi:hypothetical protein C8R44DRAFT_759774, partial [Mycena epipterygia]